MPTAPDQAQPRSRGRTVYGLSEAQACEAYYEACAAASRHVQQLRLWQSASDLLQSEISIFVCSAMPSVQFDSWIITVLRLVEFAMLTWKHFQDLHFGFTALLVHQSLDSMSVKHRLCLNVT